ncbi:hypothetical protein NDU88_002616 [Pleurodeles waltl]|uniref:Uncharacterized protein n=1 Tax=Pleurodeles waltl TaxID=8319 RepID=A0AAV7TL50_PLEWA|nr:hypothetical protein NDU88_002616 [Pleurodeles waltl]
MTAIQGSLAALEHKIEAVFIDVNLLRDALRNVADKVTTAEATIKTLQGKVSSLKQQMVRMSTLSGELERRLENAEGKLCCSNIYVLGFSERAKDSSAESFLEYWMRKEL